MIHSLNRNRLPWLAVATFLMFASAICGLLYMEDVGRISGWIGLPEYQGYVPRLQWQAGLLSALAVTFPFLAALLLGFGKGTGRRPAENSVFTYLIRVAISVLASAGFMLMLMLVFVLLGKLGVRAH